MGTKRKAVVSASVGSSSVVNGNQGGGADDALNENGTSKSGLWAAKLAQRVRSHGGLVHESVTIGNDASGMRGLVSTAPIEKGATLFRIPRTCTITAAEALQSKLGKDIVAQAALIAAELEAKAAAEENTTKKSTKPEKIREYTPSSSLPLGDIVLAAYLVVDEIDAASPNRAYHALLKAEALDDAPAWWPERDRLELLTAPADTKENRKQANTRWRSRAYDISSTLSDDAEDAFELVKEPLARACRALGTRAFNVPCLTEPLHTHEKFKRALAAVHSRSFHLGDSASVPHAVERACKDNKKKHALESEAAGSALVPLLDCANHHRKPRECAWEVEEAVSDTDGEKTTFITVTALKAFKPNDQIRITYGARSNESLLTKYGFCIVENTEPDGSSNDHVPLFLSENGEIEDRHVFDEKDAIMLRVAKTPTYTYTPFARVLDVFRTIERRKASMDPAIENVEAGAEKTDIDRTCEDFLGRDFVCEDEDDEEDDACAALMYGSGEDNCDEYDEAVMDAGRDENMQEEEMQIELDALLAMGNCLKMRSSVLQDLALTVSKSSSPRAGACVTYLNSEARTYRFYALAAAVAIRLGIQPPGFRGNPREDDAALELRVRRQELEYFKGPHEGVAKLVSAYVRVRWRA